MKQNLLKYGVMIVLATIASTGLLWADSIQEKAVGTSSALICEDSVAPAVQSIEEAFCKKENLADENVDNQISLADWISILDFVKSYRKEIALLVIAGFLVIVLFLYVMSIINRLISGNEYYLFMSVYSWRKLIFVLLFIFLSLLLDSSWFYLVVAALIIYYLDKRRLCPDLLEGIVRVIRILQGKMDIVATSDNETKERYEKLQREYKELLKINKELGIDIKQNALTEEQIEQYAQDSSRVEKLAWDYYKRFYPEMQKNVCLRVNSKRRIHVEGLLLNEDSNDILIIKYCNSVMSMAFTVLVLMDIYRAAKCLREETGKDTKILLCIVCRDTIVFKMAKLYFGMLRNKNLTIDFYTIETLLQEIETPQE